MAQSYHIYACTCTRTPVSDFPDTILLFSPRFSLQVYSWIVEIFVVEGKSHTNRGNLARDRCYQQEGVPRGASLGSACWRKSRGVGWRKGSVPNQENVAQDSGIVVCLVGESYRKLRQSCLSKNMIYACSKTFSSWKASVTMGAQRYGPKGLTIEGITWFKIVWDWQSLTSQCVWFHSFIPLSTPTTFLMLEPIMANLISVFKDHL